MDDIINTILLYIDNYDVFYTLLTRFPYSGKIPKSVINYKDKYMGETFLHDACAKDHNDIVQLMIKSGADIEVMNRYGDRPLCHACWNGHFEVVKTLIEHDVDLNVENVPYKVTPIFHACRGGNLEIVRILIENGANVNFGTRNISTPLSLAQTIQNDEIATLLIQNGAN